MAEGQRQVQLRRCSACGGQPVAAFIIRALRVDLCEDCLGELKSFIRDLETEESHWEIWEEAPPCS